jgi:acyl carrier protein
MSDNEIRDRIRDAIAKVGKIAPDAIDDRSSLRKDLGLDSLAILEALVEVQCRFQIPDIPESDFALIRTVGEAVEFVRRALRVGMA